MLTTSQEIRAIRLRRAFRHQDTIIRRCEMFQGINSFFGVLSLIALCHTAALAGQHKPVPVLDKIGCVGTGAVLIVAGSLNKKTQKAKAKQEEIHKKLRELSR